MLAALLFDNVSEGKHVITAMLVVGLIFIAVIVLGELAHRVNARRKAKRRQRRAIY